MEEDWDLHAVVRGCATITSTTSSSSVSSTSGFGTCCKPAPPSCGFFSILPSDQPCQSLTLSNPLEAKSTSIEELHELCKPFFLKSHPPSSSLQTSSPPLSSFSYSSPSPKSTQTQQKQLQQTHHAGSAATPRSKRRKNQVKKVCQVPAENLSSDIWAWRKYGQKPIKGSPYPRGYYRCSSSKGCFARKQVERNRSEPTMFIVTYTGDHNHPAPTHRNSLAGSTRQKLPTPTAEDSDKALTKPISPETSGVEEEVEFAPQNAKSESKEDIEDLMNDDEEENEFGLPDMVLTDDFFEGLDELTGSVATATGDCFADPFSATVALPT